MYQNNKKEELEGSAHLKNKTMGDKLLPIYINDKKQSHHLALINTMRFHFFHSFFKVANISDSENGLLI